MSPEQDTPINKEQKLRLKLYCFECGYIDFGSGKTYTAYSVNLDAFSRIKCKNCRSIKWRLDVDMEEV